MKLLLDTHAFLWMISDVQKLSSTVRSLLEDGNNELVLSAASLWEIAIKLSIGKLQLSDPFEILFPQQLAFYQIEIWETAMKYYSAVATLPLHHRDPFDRLIIAQAHVENVPVVSVDEKFDDYPIKRLW